MTLLCCYMYLEDSLAFHVHSQWNVSVKKFLDNTLFCISPAFHFVQTKFIS